MKHALAIFLTLFAFCFVAKAQTVATVSDSTAAKLEYLPKLQLACQPDSIKLPWQEEYKHKYFARRIGCLIEMGGSFYYDIIIMPGTPACIGTVARLYWMIQPWQDFGHYRYPWTDFPYGSSIYSDVAEQPPVTTWSLVEPLYSVKE